MPDSQRRNLPLVYAGQDEGARPETRYQVCEALRRGVDPVVVVDHVARGLDELWRAYLQTDFGAGQRPACGSRCPWCCHQRVEVTAPEVLLLVRQLRGPDTERYRERLRATADRLARLTAREHHEQQIRCALLSDAGECSVYASRPLACRRAHSLDPSVCAAVHADPSAPGVVPQAPGLNWNLSALVLGYLEGLHHAGYPPHHYELHQALAMGLSESDIEVRYAQGENVLAAAMTLSADGLASLWRREDDR